MPGPRPSTLLVIPPPGPLAWLYPELARLSIFPGAPSGLRSEHSSARRMVLGLGRRGPTPARWMVLDLGRRGRTGRALIREIRRLAPGRVVVPDGPRGHTLRLWLAQALRPLGIPVAWASPDPPPADEEPDAMGPDGPPLETLLSAAARLASPAEGGIVRVALDGRPEPSAAGRLSSPAEGGLVRVTLDGRQERSAAGRDPASAAGSGDAALREPGWLRLLPLIPDARLVLRLERALAAVAAADPLLAEEAPIPYFVTRFQEPGGGRAALGPPPRRTRSRGGDDRGAAPPGRRERGAEEIQTRLLPSWWGLLPGDSYPPRVRELYRELLRRLHPERHFLFLALENYALAGIDLYAEALAGRFTPPAGPGRRAPEGAAVRRRASGQRPAVIAVCGIDGAGKSSQAASLQTFFTGRGASAAVQRIYRHGVFHLTITDLTRRCGGDRHLHLWRLQRLVKAFDTIKCLCSEAGRALADHEVLIFDRYVYTHFADGLGRLHHDPFLRELLSLYPPADRVYLLDLPPAEALRRIGDRTARTVDENPYMLSRYRHALLDLGDRGSFLTLDGRAPFAELARIILADAARLLPPAGGARRPRPGGGLAPAPQLARGREGGPARVAAAEAAAWIVDAGGGRGAPGPPPADRRRGTSRAAVAGKPVWIVDAGGGRGAAEREIVPLIADGGEYALAVRRISTPGSRSAAASIPDEVFLHLYAYELLERLREWAAEGGSESGPALLLPFWPECLFQAAGITAHAAQEIQAAFPPSARTAYVRRSARAVEKEARRVLGGVRFDPAAYLAAAETTALANGWAIGG